MTPNQCVSRIVYQQHIITQKVTANIVFATISDFLEDGTLIYIHLVRIGFVTISTPFEPHDPNGHESRYVETREILRDDKVFLGFL